MKQDSLKSKALFIAVATAMTVGVAGCGGDDSGSGNEDKCANVVCDVEGQTCNPDTGACEDADDNKCANVVCDVEGQVCNPSTGECEDSGSTEEPLECGENEEDCGGTCKNIKTDIENCGGCGIICDTAAGETCEDGICVIPAVCEDTEAATCDAAANGVKKCVDGQYVVEACGDKVCMDGEGGASCQDAAPECDANTPASCEGNAAKTCGNDGKFVMTDCGDKACVDGVCSEEAFVAECEDSVAPTCDAEKNAIKSCVNQKWNYVACGTLTCQADESGAPACQNVFVADCDETHIVTCEGESALKICDMEKGGVFATKTCGSEEYCYAKDESTSAECKKKQLDDLCPDDANKTAPGVCGCGVPDSDLNKNNTIDCLENDADLCPDDPKKTLPGICGCGVPDDGEIPTCLSAGKDMCPGDETKTLPGVCGCGIPDTFDNYTHQPWCIGADSFGINYDSCTYNDKKNLPGICGCDVSDEDSDSNGTIDCLEEGLDMCPDDDNKTNVGFCGCGIEDVKEDGKYTCDKDGDGVPDALDHCPEHPHKYLEDKCECNEARVNVDGKEFCATMLHNAEDFFEFRNNVVKNVKNGTNDIYILANDINIGEYLETTETDWTTGTFRGKLIGSNKKIEYKTADGSVGTLVCTDLQRCGLFYNLTGAYIEGIEFNFNVRSNKSYTGMLAGYADGGTTINNVKISGNVNATSERVGGLIGGTNNVNITDIQSSGDVTGKGNYVGGLVGSATNTRISNVTREGNVVNEHANGHYTGGIAGTLEHASSMLTDIQVKGDITGNWHYVGGVVGYMNHGGPISKVNFDGNVTNNGGYNVGGIAGYACAVSSDIVVKGAITGQRVAGGAFGGHSCGNITNVENYATITTVNKIGGTVATGGIAGSVGGGFTFKNLVNHADINSGCEPVQSNWCNDNGGIFGNLQANSNANSTLEDLENKGQISVKGSYNGGIIGDGWSSSAKNLKNSGSISGAASVSGGIFGRFQNNTATATTFENFENTGNISSRGEYAAGIMGDGFATNMKNMKNSGQINGGTNYISGIVGRYINNARERSNLENIDNQGNITATGSYVGGIVGYAYSVNLKNAKNVGNITGGASYNGGIIGVYEVPTNANKTADYVLENLSNTGKVEAYADHNGGLVGRIGFVVNEKKLVIKNVSSTGAVTGRDSLGGAIGSMIHNATAELTDIYATGSVSSTTKEGYASRYNVAGLIGNIEANNGDIFRDAPKKRTHTTIIDRAYATGDVTASNAENVAGFIGGLTAHSNVSHVVSTSVKCPSDASKTYNENRESYYQVDHTTKLTNVYAHGKVSGKHDVGGLIGELYALSKQEKKTVNYTKYNADCSGKETEPKEISANRTSKVIIANVYAAGEAISSTNHSYAGGLIGRYNYTNDLNQTTYAHLMNNVYATGNVASNGSNFIGLTTPANLPNITYKNTYYLPTAGSDAETPVKGNATIPENVLKFAYQSAIPHVGSDKLINKLNTNIAASLAAELGSKVSSKWVDVKYSKLTIPTLDIAPKEFTLGEEPSAE